MPVEIKHKITKTVIKTVEAETLTGANLYGADLTGADLTGATMRTRALLASLDAHK